MPPPPLRGNVLITGGAGYLGRAVIGRADRESWPCNITIYSRGEEKQAQVRRRWPGVKTLLGDVRGYDRLINACRYQETVIHAAAIKDIPGAEANVQETMEINVVGSRNVSVAASKMGVRQVVGISTDKACMPVNTYGATKMLLERLFAERNSWARGVAFGCVRYGNVIGSTGSIVPVFKQQAADKGRVSVTNPDMTRFWLTVDAAVDLILQAVADTEGGKVIVPRCPAMRLGDLAKAVVGDIPMDVIGSRPGEKTHETLIHHQESLRTELHGDYFQVRPAETPVDDADGWTYSSHNPASWVTQDEMRKAIEDAEAV